MNKDLFKKKVRADKFLEQLRKDEDPEFLQILHMSVKHDPKEKFRKAIC